MVFDERTYCGMEAKPDDVMVSFPARRSSILFNLADFGLAMLVRSSPGQSIDVVFASGLIEVHVSNIGHSLMAALTALL
jgi:hypothetical protein